MIDTIAPYIRLFGGDTIYHAEGFRFSDPGAIGIDHYYGFLPVEKTGNVDHNSAGVYHLTYRCTDPSGNEAPEKTRVVIVEENVRLSPEKFEASFNLKIQPNPSTGEFKLTAPNPENTTLSFTLYDMRGRVLLQQILPSEITFQHEINVENLPAGEYILYWQYNDRNGWEKLIFID